MFAIQLNNENNVENAYGIAKRLTQLGKDVIVFSQLENEKDEKDREGIKTEKVPKDKASNDFIAKNFIISKFEESYGSGFLHIIEDAVKIEKDPNDFILAIERVMDVFDYDSWFSTVTDRCNYVFNKFNPRLEFILDDPEDPVSNKLGIPKNLMFTSHANTFWTIYHRRNSSHSIQRYSECFSISMFAIIEYLARRKASRSGNQPYFMNQYLSIREEIGTFSFIDMHQQSKANEKEIMQKEDALFKSMNVNFAPDNNIDIVLETVYQKIQEKIQAINTNGQEQKTIDTAS